MATNIWRGDAGDVSREVEMVLSGTWAAAETITITIGGQALVLTIGTTIDIPTVLNNLIVMLTGVGTFDTSYSSANNLRGSQLGMFAELTYTEDGTDTLTIEATTASRPFVIAQSETSTLGSIAQTTTVFGSSKNDFDTADNWSLGTVPVAADDVVYEDSDIDCLYNIDQAIIAHNSIKVRQSFTGRLGLPEINREGIAYDEYRDTFLKTISLDVEIGEGGGTGSGRIKIDSVAANNVVIDVKNTGGALDTALGAFIWKGTGTGITLTAQNGEVGLGMFGFDNADIATLTGIDATVIHLNGTATTINMDGIGTLNSNATITDLLQKGDATTTLTGTLVGGGSSIIVEAGTVIDHSTGTVDDLTVMNKATYSLEASPQASRTVTNKATFHVGSTVNDPLGILVLTGGFTIPGGERGDITATFGKDRSQYDVA